MWLTARAFCCALFTVFSVLTNCSSAFDTGHHLDLTRAALASPEVGFDTTAVTVVQVENWLVDWYSNSITSPSEIKAHAVHLHFDSLHEENLLLESRDSLDRYWRRLAANTKQEVIEATTNQDAVKLLAVLGASLHCVQDFYTHTDWVETHPRQPGQPYRTDLWFSYQLGEIPGKIRAGRYPNDEDHPGIRHGSYKDVGMNHDSYNRKRWDEAYGLALIHI